VKVNLNNEIRLIEIDRRAPSFSSLKNGIRTKYGLNSDPPTLTYLLPTGTKITIKSDDDLRRAIFESGNAGHFEVDIDIHGVSLPKQQQQPVRSTQPAQAKPQQQQHQQHQQHQQPARQQQYAPAPAQQQYAQPVTKTTGVISFVIPASGNAEKAKITAVPDSNCYKFIPTSAALDTTVEVEIPTPKTLSFKLVSSTSRLAQTFNMPFEINYSSLMLQGTTVILNFPGG